MEHEGMDLDAVDLGAVLTEADRQCAIDLQAAEDQVTKYATLSSFAFLPRVSCSTRRPQHALTVDQRHAQLHACSVRMANS